MEEIMWSLSLQLYNAHYTTESNSQYLRTCPHLSPLTSLPLRLPHQSRPSRLKLYGPPSLPLASSSPWPPRFLSPPPASLLQCLSSLASTLTSSTSIPRHNRTSPVTVLTLDPFEPYLAGDSVVIIYLGASRAPPPLFILSMVVALVGTTYMIKWKVSRHVSSSMWMYSSGNDVIKIKRPELELLMAK